MYCHIAPERLLVFAQHLEALSIAAELVPHMIDDSLRAEIASGLQYVHLMLEPECEEFIPFQPELQEKKNFIILDGLLED